MTTENYCRLCRAKLLKNTDSLMGSLLRLYNKTTGTYIFDDEEHLNHGQICFNCLNKWYFKREQSCLGKIEVGGAIVYCDYCGRQKPCRYSLDIDARSGLYICRMDLCDECIAKLLWFLKTDEEKEEPKEKEKLPWYKRLRAVLLKITGV